jgi:hypothetical protein
MLLDHINQVQIDNLTNCRVFVGACCFAAMLLQCIVYLLGVGHGNRSQLGVRLRTQLHQLHLHHRVVRPIEFSRTCLGCGGSNNAPACSKQLRTRDCSGVSIYLYSLTDPIIETSQQMTFAPFNGAYCGIERVSFFNWYGSWNCDLLAYYVLQNFTDAHLEPANNHWSQVYDFNDPDKTGCNWRILSTFSYRLSSSLTSRVF